MENQVNYRELLQRLFSVYDVKMTPASDASLKLFKERTTERNVPSTVISELCDFYSIVDGVPGLDSLSIHECADLIIFEWWDNRELWLGQRDMYILRWSNDKYCIGDAGEVSFSPSDEHQTFAAALTQLVKKYDPPESE